MKRILAGILSLCLMSGALVGCAPEEKSPSKSESQVTSPSESVAEPEKSPVEITLWLTSKNQDPLSLQTEKEFLAEHPWITLNKVVKEGDPGNEFYQGVAIGNAPDAVNVSFTMMDKYIATGILEPLNSYVDQWDEWDNYTQGYVDMFTRDGNTYGLPITVAPMLFAYNKALFRDAGVETIPSTWEEAVTAAKAISDPENQIVGYATLTAEWTEWFFQYYVWQAGGDLTQQNDDGTVNLTFTDPAVIAAAEYYQLLRNEGVLQSDLTLKFGDLITAFGQGKIAMMPFAGDWVSQAIASGIAPDDIGLMLPPAGPSGERATAIAGSAWVINAKSSQDKKDAAWEYIEFVCNKEATTNYYNDIASKGAANPMIIPRDDMSISDFFEFPEEYKTVLESVTKAGRMEFYGKSSFGTYVDRAVQKILVDPNADPEKEFAAAQKMCEEEALAEFNELNKR